MAVVPQRSIEWMGPTKEDISPMPDPVKKDFGHALCFAQEALLIKTRLKNAQDDYLRKYPSNTQIGNQKKGDGHEKRK